MVTAEFTDILTFFKALSDESRLRIIGQLANSERSVEELASMLSLKAPTISHHLSKLKEIGLVEMRSDGTTHLYELRSERLRKLSKQVLALQTIAIDTDIAADAWERQILSNFFDGDRLKEIPASRKKRHVILKWLAKKFDAKRRYTEKEVNTIIGKHHPDFCTIRRELVGASLLTRDKGIYWRVSKASN